MHSVKNSRLSILIVALMVGLLALLAVLQYRWQGQISDGERERLQKRLQTDSKRFADDFNKEIRESYFVFRVDPESWRKKDYSEFNQRYELWHSKTAYPNLIKDFYFVGKDSVPLRYNFAQKTFAPTEQTDELSEIGDKIKQNAHSEDVSPILQNPYTLLIANQSEDGEIKISENGMPQMPSTLLGYLVIKFDKEIVNQIISDLNKHYFLDGENSDYDVAVTDTQNGQTIFQSNQNKIISKDSSDASMRFYDLALSNYFVAINRKVYSPNLVKTKKIITHQKPDENAPPISETDKSPGLKVKLADSNERRAEETENKGIWLLTVQHRDGSLENFINAARRKNLAISFGILGLLGASVILIFLSARRAQTLAQRQLDFVSAVSHEFRTPLAVIYSAGENLTDGVVSSRTQIEKYGGLIKREGKKLSAMVEQILEFAGARSGRRKYDFRRVEIAPIIQNALCECSPLIAEKHFEIESDISENLPPISGDEKALSQAVQNLIANGLKYSGESSKLKISAKNGGGEIKIAVEDFGIGIAPKDLRQIFQPFYRAKEVVDAQIHGNGLGLNLVKQIVEAHGGKIEAASKIGQGSKFTIHLPIVI